MVNLFKLFSDEIGRCYIEQNENLTDEELEFCLELDEEILSGIVMENLIEINGYSSIHDLKDIWVYGTLREGEYNHYLITDGEHKKIGKGKVFGFKMFSFGSYPFSVEGNEFDKIVVEGYSVTEENYNKIMDMEKSSGYTLKEVEIIGDDKKYRGNIFIMDRVYRNFGSVENGDWKNNHKLFLGRGIN